MDMAILRQNRWVALLIGALFVSLSLINLLSLQADAGKEEQTLSLTEKAEAAPSAVKAAGPAMLDPKLKKKVPDLIKFKPYQTWKPAQQDKPLSYKALGALMKDASGTATQASRKPRAELALKTADQAELKKQKGTKILHSKAESLQPPTTLFFTRTKTLTQEEKDQATWEYALSAGELLLLQKIVMAEAEGEPYEGKVAVANVVLNRLRSANFPNTITKVIYQKHQFSPVANGRLKRVRPSAETVKAVNAALNGHKAVQDNTYFFLSLTLAQDLTVHHHRTFVKKIGNHSFYK